MNLLLVCSGNICRSPMAERLAERIGDRVGLDVHARSAGTLGIEGRPADPHAVAVLAEVGLDLSDHVSQGLTDALVTWADHILVMEPAHAAFVADRWPGQRHKVLALGPLVGQREIADPIGGWRFRFRRIRKQLEQALEAFYVRVGRL